VIEMKGTQKAARAKKTTAAAKTKAILVGDIGGTRTRLALYEASSRKALAEAVISSRDHASFEDIALPFLAGEGDVRPAAAVFGVAGPVRKGIATVTNLPWRLDERALSRRLGIPNVLLTNDLVVAARGCLHVPPGSIEVITEKKPTPKGSNVAVIAAGTGLGEARLIWTGDRHLTLAAEGGHADFAPGSPLQIELWHFLANRFPDHVSYERILSGNGLGALYDFFASRAGREPRAIAKRLAQEDRNAVISELGLTRQHRPAALAVDLFASVYGAEAGNLALREMAVGGVFITGNIGRTIIPPRREVFLDAFRKKGRLSGLMADIPVAVVTDPFVGVIGALAMARDILANQGAIAPKRRARA
jgi:glucokinase